MRNNIKDKKLCEEMTTLMDEVDELRSTGKDVTILDRAAEIGNIGILYFDSLNEEEIDIVLSVVDLALKQINNLKAGLTQVNTNLLEGVVDQVEDLYRSKKFLLDKTEEKNMSQAA